MTDNWVPDAGDIVWLRFDPQSGREQAGHRPGLVVSPATYNRMTGLMLCVPMTSRAKGFRFEVAFRDGGIALADQIKSLDWRARGATPKAKASPAELAAVRARVRALVG